MVLHLVLQNKKGAGNQHLNSGFVLGAGLEPAQPQWPKDFKSFVSTIPPSEQLFCSLAVCALWLKSGAKITLMFVFTNLLKVYFLNFQLCTGLKQPMDVITGCKGLTAKNSGLYRVYMCAGGCMSRCLCRLMFRDRNRCMR